MYKIIFSDIDNTLAIKKDITKKNINAIKLFEDKGGIFVLSTGRDIPYTKDIKNIIDTSRYMICTNGASIYDTLNDNLIYSSNISYETLNKLFAISDKDNVRIQINGAKSNYTTKVEDKKIEKNIDKVTKELYESDNISQVMIQSNYKEPILDIIKEVEKLEDVYICNRKRSLYDNTFKHTGSYWINIINKGNDKGTSIKRLLDHLNIELKDSIRVGDDMNDISMFMEEGFNVSVSNGYEEFKNEADYITGNVNDDSIERIIKEYILK